MQSTVHGFSQKNLIKLGLDLCDAIILRYFIDCKEHKKMRTKVIDRNTYYWVRYDKVLEDLPLLRMKKYTIQSRFFKLRDLGVITHYVLREGGTYSYFGIGENYINLITECEEETSLS